MGSIMHRKYRETALSNMKNYFEKRDRADGLEYFRAISGDLARAIDEYVFVRGGKKCVCGEVLTPNAKSGLCPSCYRKRLAKTDKFKERRKRQRLNAKLRVLQRV